MSCNKKIVITDKSLKFGIPLTFTYNRVVEQVSSRNKSVQGISKAIILIASIKVIILHSLDIFFLNLAYTIQFHK